jgi:hypothetical protein
VVTLPVLAWFLGTCVGYQPVQPAGAHDHWLLPGGTHPKLEVRQDIRSVVEVDICAGYFSGPTASFTEEWIEKMLIRPVMRKIFRMRSFVHTS